MKQERSQDDAGVATGLALLFPITLSTMAIVLLVPVLPMLMREFSAVPGGEYWVPMILTLPALCVALFSPVAGLLGDRFGRRRLLLASLFVYGIVGTAPLYLQGFWPVLASRLGVGITEAVIMTMSTTMIADAFEGEARNRWLAGQTALASVSATVFFGIGGALGELGWRAPFVVYGAAFVMLIGVAAFTREIPRRPADGPGTVRVRFPVARVAGVVAVTLFGSVLFYTLNIQAAPALAERGVTEPSRIGLLTALASTGVLLGTFVYSRVSRAGAPTLLAVEFLLAGIGFAVASFAPGVAGFMAGLVLGLFAAGMMLPTLLVWAVSGVAYEIRGQVTGIWTGAFTLGQWLSPITITLIGIVAGGLLPSFGYLAGAAVLAALTAFILRGRGGSPAPSEV